MYNRMMNILREKNVSDDLKIRTQYTTDHYIVSTGVFENERYRYRVLITHNGNICSSAESTISLLSAFRVARKRALHQLFMEL